MDSYIRNYDNPEVNTTLINSFENNILEIDDQYINIFHTNIRSINKNYDELLVFLQAIPIKYHIIVLTETWTVENISLFNLEGYNIYYNQGQFNQNDGVIVYTRLDLNTKHDLVNLQEINNKILKIEFEINRRTFLISALYRSPAGNIQTFNSCLNKYLNTINNLHPDNSILIGDMNINILIEDHDSADYYNTKHQ